MAKAKIRTIEGFEKAVMDFLYEKEKGEEVKDAQNEAKKQLIEAAEAELGVEEKSIRFSAGSLAVTISRKETLPSLDEKTATKIIQLAGPRYVVDSTTKVSHRLNMENAQKFLEEDHSNHPKLAEAQGLIKKHLAKSQEKWSAEEHTPKEKAVKGAA